MTQLELAHTKEVLRKFIAAGRITVAPPDPNCRYSDPPSEVILGNRKRALESYRRKAKEFLAQGLTTSGLPRKTKQAKEAT